MNSGLNTHYQAPLLAQLTRKVADKVDQVGHNLLTAMLKRVWVVLQQYTVKALDDKTYINNCEMTIRHLVMAGLAPMYTTYPHWMVKSLVCDAQTVTKASVVVLCMLTFETLEVTLTSSQHGDSCNADFVQTMHHA